MIPLAQLKEKLVGYPDSLVDAYARILEDRDTDALNRFVIGLLAFLQENSESLGEATADSARLREDLNVDSITIAEIVFLLEDIFEVEISAAELVEIVTLGDLKAFLRSKLF